MSQLHDFFYLIFGGFLLLGPTVLQQRVAREMRYWQVKFDNHNIVVLLLSKEAIFVIFVPLVKYLQEVCIGNNG